MQRVGGEEAGMPTSIRQVVVASFIGTTIEWCDYFHRGLYHPPVRLALRAAGVIA